MQELASNLQYPELAEFSLNQMCKGRFTGHWSQSPGKWAGQEQLLAAAAAQQHSQALLNVGDSPADGQHPRQANLVLLDYPMQSQQRLLDPEELQQLQVSPLIRSISCFFFFNLNFTSNSTSKPQLHCCHSLRIMLALLLPDNSSHSSNFTQHCLIAPNFSFSNINSKSHLKMIRS